MNLSDQHFTKQLAAILNLHNNMPASYRCFPPCLKSFPTTKALNAHISNKPDCFERYSQFLLSLVGPAPPKLRADSPQSDKEPASSALSSPFEAPFHFSPQDPVGGLDALTLDGASMATEPEHPWVGVHPGMQEPPTNDEREYVEVYPHAGRILHRDQSAYEKILNDLERDSPHNMYYPFASQSEWGLAVFLHNNLAFSEINNFLKLQFVRIIIYYHTKNAHCSIDAVTSTILPIRSCFA
jgi:hypothetical protein